MKFVYCLIFFIENTLCRAVDKEKVEFCRNLGCEQIDDNKNVCGWRQEGEGIRLKLFQNECGLLKYGCRVKDEDAYGIINLKYCVPTFTTNSSRRQSNVQSPNNKLYHETFNDITENLCNKMNCAHTSVNHICGLRRDGQGFKIRLFFNKCEMIKYNCENKFDFRITDLRICKGMHRSREPIDDSISQNTTKTVDDADYNDVEGSTLYVDMASNEETLPQKDTNDVEGVDNDVSTNGDESDESTTILVEPTVPYETDLPIDYVDVAANEETLPQKDTNEVKGVDNDVSTNGDESDDSATSLVETTVPYETDLPIDYGDLTADSTSTSTTEGVKYINDVPVPKNLIVLDGGMVNFNGNINETMDNFFAATHVFDLPVREVRKEAEILNDSFRRMQMRIVGPVKVFKPWIVIPNNISTDTYHQPTLSSCYHKCPTVCPDTYAPVCGVPGIVAREPSLMFKNHCFMDAAQCKMRWEDKSDTAESSSYIESSFMICLGDNLNGLYRFLPLIRTLQHMGRLKRKGKFHYKLRNMRFISQYLSREPRPMG